MRESQLSIRSMFPWFLYEQGTKWTKNEVFKFLEKLLYWIFGRFFRIVTTVRKHA